METLFELGAIIIGLTEMLKQLVPDRYRAKLMPLVSVLMGATANSYLNGWSSEPEIILYGLALGLTATGLYKTIK